LADFFFAQYAFMRLLTLLRSAADIGRRLRRPANLGDLIPKAVKACSMALI
jgi:hypothetical protein